jgi:hypothetical protein
MSMSLPQELYERFKHAVPKYGGRSIVLRQLILGFLSGKYQLDTIKPVK